MASFSLVTSQPRVWGNIVSQVSLPIGGKYMVVGTGGVVMGAMVESSLLQEIKNRLSAITASIDFIKKRLKIL